MKTTKKKNNTKNNYSRRSIMTYLNKNSIKVFEDSKSKSCQLKHRNYCGCHITDINKKEFNDLIHKHYKQNPQTVPRIIHQIWIGPKKPPTKWMNTFRNYVKKNKGWKYFLWTDSNINKLKLINKKQYDLEPSYVGKADILRCELLYKYGGIYIDADSALTGNQDINKLIDNCSNLGFFIAKECKVCGNSLASGVIGCSRKNLIMNYIIRTIPKISNTCIKNKYHPYLSIGPYMYDQCLKGLDITIYPYYYFYPKYWHGNLLNEDITKYKKSYMFQYGYSTNNLEIS